MSVLRGYCMKGICPFCKREVEYQHSIELSVFRYHFHKVYGVMVWDYCPECKRAISYAKYDMKRDKSRFIRYRAYMSEKVYGGSYDDRS